GSIEWLRPHKINTGYNINYVKWSVTNNPNQADVCQGSLGNCWFLSALSMVAEKIHLIDNILITQKISPQGIYQVRLCVHGKWEVVLVDDFFP
ncbi:C2 family cysteine protease, partial [Salmonella sp. s54836]|uniref:C2 family cysteine protease n=1 Tax=Salmonella sp. s54836 TaxID=3159673 RepID=UPI00397F46AB